MLQRVVLLIMCLFVAGCAAELTPGVRVEKDNYDDTRIVLQPPVGSALFSDDAWTLLGFEWQERNPDVVFMKVGLDGTINITGLDLKADGIEIGGIERTSTVTDFESNAYYSRSWGRFKMPIGEFRKVAGAADVRMRLTLLDKYTVSRFGSGHSPAPVVNTKFNPFLDKVAELRGGLD